MKYKFKIFVPIIFISLFVGFLVCFLVSRGDAGVVIPEDKYYLPPVSLPKDCYYVDSEGGRDSNDGKSPANAWRSLRRVNKGDFNAPCAVLFRRGRSWRGSLVPKSGGGKNFVLYGVWGQGAKPRILGSVAKNKESDWTRTGENIWSANLAENEVNIGNIIFNDGASAGFKVWSEEDLDAPGRYYYNREKNTVTLYCKGNPARSYREIEIALGKTIVDQANKHHVIYENLDVRYGGVHGFGGDNTNNIVIRDCNIAFIGGSVIKGTYRYGNGVEFWGTAHDNYVIGNVIWEIFDAGLTNQSSGYAARQCNIYYRNNIIINSEYSFEYWNHPENAVTKNIFFENNTCVNAGYGWGHDQRGDSRGNGCKDGTGIHLCLSANTAATSNIFIRNNIFYNAKQAGIRLIFKKSPRGDYYWNGFDSLVMDYNLWYQPSGFFALVKKEAYKNYSLALLDNFRSQYDKCRHDLIANPLFVNPEKRDFHLKSFAGAWNGKGWVKFNENSPAIDGGFPASSFSLEPNRNGRRVNLGAFGNTKEASLSTR